MKPLSTLPTAFLILMAALLAPPPLAAGEARTLTVVELFTSQGCSSCPAADAVLRDLARRDDVLALSLHVDYWDYIGWKDPFSDTAYTQRQRAYAERFHLRYVYTPQMVVQGTEQGVGSDRAAVEAMISRQARPPQVQLSAAAAKDGAITVMLPETALSAPALVWVASYDPEHTTEVRRGENTGRTLVNANVVRGLKPVLSWTGRAQTLTIPAASAAGDGPRAAVVVQSTDNGPILGAARVVPAR